jgi:hypothetical protein
MVEAVHEGESLIKEALRFWIRRRDWMTMLAETRHKSCRFFWRRPARIGSRMARRG